MTKIKSLALCAMLLAPLTALQAADFNAVQLRVNDIDAPIGLDATDVSTLRFGWVLDSQQRAFTQSAYQILVASSQQVLDHDQGDLWDSGKVVSPGQNGIAYAGKPLAGKTAYWWKVRIWDGDGKQGEWSPPAIFETGIVDADKDWKGNFVGGLDAKTKSSFNLMRREFSLPPGKVISWARVYVAANTMSRSYWDFHINGQRVDDRVIFRSGYFTFDATKLLHAGAANAIGVMLGGDGDKHKDWLCDVDVWFTDGTRLTVGTDQNCKGFAGGPVVSATELAGENYDARKEAEVAGWDAPGFQDQGWSAVKLFPGTKRPDTGHQRDAVRIHETLPAVAMTEPKPGVRIFDIGRNISGWARMTVKGKAGTVVTLRYAERVKADGSLDRSSNLTGLPAQAIDQYILKGDGTETWEPFLTYHGFRYVEVTGDVELTQKSVEGRWIHSDILRREAVFSCSDALLNREFDAFRTGELDNSMYWHTDCNQRGERAPWSADAYACSAASLALFDSADFWQHWIRISNSKVGPHGESSHWLPGAEGFALLWQAQCLFIPWDFHQACGDMSTFVPAYERARKFADCIINWFDPLDEVVCKKGTKPPKVVSSVNHHDFLIEADKPWKDEAGKNVANPFWNWGDWCYPKSKQIPANVSALTSMYYFRCMDLVAREAEMLGRKDDAAKYSAVAAKVKAAVNARYLASNGNRYYGNNDQALNALALFIGIVPTESRAAVAQSLADDIRSKKDHLDTGVIGTLHILRALTETGHDDTALALAQQTSYPSWGFMLADPKAPGTFWETWQNDDHSKNHPFLGGALASWLLNSVAGIRAIEPGYAEIEFKPCLAVVKNLTTARANLPTVRGTAAISWTRKDADISLDVTVPANSHARIYIPVPATATIREDASVLWQNNAFKNGVVGISAATANNGYVFVEAGSGRYHFIATNPDHQ
jgi:alpha-L-rhamnosidase